MVIELQDGGPRNDMSLLYFTIKEGDTRAVEMVQF